MKHALLALVLLATPAFATADGPDAWRVTGVSLNDVLNLRAGPSVAYPVIGHLPPDARGLQTEICVPTLEFATWDSMSEAERAAVAALPRWCLLSKDGARLGWAAGAYLTEDDLP